MENIILIPAYNPDDKLIKLIENLIDLKLKIVLVNDGSEKIYDYIFYFIKNEYKVNVINHEKNKGKGMAIKTGIKYIMDNYYDCTGIITADSDGQHLPKDIEKISNSIIKNPNSLILGTRDFNQSNIPIKSRLGNKITSFIFYLSTHKKCKDTQTGLRGIPRKLFDKCLNIPGERYEYEMNMLMQFAINNINFIYENIDTVYINRNKSSHFHPIKDSIKIYFNILKFSLSSLMSSIVDITIFTVLMYFLDMNIAYKILIATILSRLISGIFNFIINKLWVFSNQDEIVRQGFKYILLFLIIMMGSYLGVSILSFLPIPIIATKIMVDGSLFVLSYKIQNRLIFANGR